MRQLLFDFAIKIPNVRANIMGAIKRANINAGKEVK